MTPHTAYIASKDLLGYKQLGIYSKNNNRLTCLLLRMGVCVCGWVGMGAGAMTTGVRGPAYLILGVPLAGQETEPCWLFSEMMMMMIALYSTVLHSRAESLHFCHMQF